MAASRNYVIVPALLLAVSAAPTGAQAPPPMEAVVGSVRRPLSTVGVPMGSAMAPIWMVEFADFGCSYCEKFALDTKPILDSLYIRPGKLFVRFVPYVTGMFRNSREAAESSLCANEQGRFWQMHDLLYAKRTEWRASSRPRPLMSRYAASLGLDVAKFAKCAEGAAVTEQVTANTELAHQLSIRGTPTFFINGEVVPGALPAEAFVQAFNYMLARKR